MGRGGGGNYISDKRQREAEKAQRKAEKAERRMRKRTEGPAEIEVISAEEVTGALPSVEDVMRQMEQRATAPRGAAPIPSRLFVGSLSRTTTQDELRASFARFGTVIDAVVMTDRDTGNSRGFGFVTMENRKDAANAIANLHNSELDGRNIVVNIATERSR